MKLFILILLPISLFAQAGIDYVSTDPTGHCTGYQNLKGNLNNGHVSMCVAGNWGLIGGSGLSAPSTSNLLTSPGGTLTDSGINPTKVVTRMRWQRYGRESVTCHQSSKRLPKLCW